MKKILFIAHMDSHIACFHLPYLKWFKDQGFIVHVASNKKEHTTEILYCDTKYQVDFQKSPFSFKNIKAYKQIKKILKENKYDIIHVHTPMGSIVGRFACYFTHTKPVIYTAHGFHFYKGAGIINWLIYYNIERFFAKLTNEVILINDEDYNLALLKFSKKTLISKVNGVGVDLSQYYPQDNEIILKNRGKLGLNNEDIVLSYIGRLSKGKNQTFLIEVMKELVKLNPNFKLLLVGLGPQEIYQKLIKKYNLINNVILLGFRKDINDIVNLSDIIVSSSIHEGLPRNILEAMAIGKPIIASNVRGHRDLVIDNNNGLLYKLHDKQDFINKVIYLTSRPELTKEFGENSLKIVEKYKIENVIEEMKKIYQKYIDL